MRGAGKPRTCVACQLAINRSAAAKKLTSGPAAAVARAIKQEECLPNKQNKKGRAKNDARHVRLYHFLLNGEAWLSLSPAARAVYIEIHQIYDGSNNGRLGLSVRRAAERCHIAKDTAARAFRELLDRGFIEVVTKSAFSLKLRRATEWRLTVYSCDATGELPSYKFNKWREQVQNTVPIQTATVPDEGHQEAPKQLKAA